MDWPSPFRPGRPDGEDHRSPAGVLGGVDRFDAALTRWLAEATVDEAAAARSRTRWLRVAAESEATLAGTLYELAEAGRRVVLGCEVGAEGGGADTIRGRIVGLGEDFVVVAAPDGLRTVARTSGIETVAAAPGERSVRGDRSPIVALTLASALQALAEDRPDVVVVTRSGRRLRGRLVSTGIDVVRVRTEGDPPITATVATATILQLVLR